MTTTKDKQKKTPDFYIFLEGPEGNRYAGTAYCHKNCSGLGITIGGMRCVAFQPKPKSGKKEGA